MDINKLELQEPREQSFGGRSIAILHDNAPFTFDTEALLTPWGIQSYTVSNSWTVAYSVSVYPAGLTPMINKLEDFVCRSCPNTEGLGGN